MRILVMSQLEIELILIHAHLGRYLHVQPAFCDQICTASV